MKKVSYIFEMVQSKRWMFDNRVRGENHPNAKLRNEDVLKIRKLASLGFSIKIIARNYNISLWNVGEIVKRKTWTHI